jgi:hypothetical protein
MWYTLNFHVRFLGSPVDKKLQYCITYEYLFYEFMYSAMLNENFIEVNCSILIVILSYCISVSETVIIDSVNTYKPIFPIHFHAYGSLQII